MDEEKEVTAIPEGTAAPESGWRKKVKDYYKDREFTSDGDIDTAAEELIDELMGDKEKSREANKRLIEVFQTYEPVAEFIADLMDDVPFPVALARHFDPEEFTPGEEDPDRAAWKEAADKRRSQKEERANFEKELTANKVESSKAFADFQSEMGMTDEESDAFIDKVDDFLKDLYRGKISKDFLSAMYKATDYDNALKSAREQAALSARNEKIELEKKNYTKPKGDGLPDVKTSGTQTETPPQPPKPRFLQSLDEIEKRQQTRI